MGFDTDWQKMAYVLKTGEKDAPSIELNTATPIPE
jgi:hypothetical protein